MPGRAPDFRMVVTSVNSAGKTTVTGIPAQLKSSQSYPRGFGEAMRSVYSLHEGELKAAACRLVPDLRKVGFRSSLGLDLSDEWADAGMPALLQFIRS